MYWVIFLSCFITATNPAKVKSRKQATSVFKTNPEGKLVIREDTEGEGKGERLGGNQGQEVEEEEEMDVDEVIPPVPVNGRRYHTQSFLMQSARLKRKRKRSASRGDEDDDMPSRTTSSGRSHGGGGGKGIHRFNAHKHDFDFDYGAEYRAKVRG